MESYVHLSPESGVTFFPDEPIVYAGFWERFAAGIIDGLILAIPNLLFQYTLGPAGTFLSLVMIWLYAAIQESGSAQSTIGKKIVGIRVQGENGERLSFGQATGRHFGKWISTLILFVGFLMMLWDENKQTLHDKMAGAFIVKK